MALRIREPLPPRRRILINVVSVLAMLALWVLLTLPMLPADTPPAVQTSAIDSGERVNEGLASDVGPATDPPATVADSGERRPIIPASILPSPMQVVAALGYLHREQALVRSAVVSFWRITAAFLLSALVAIPLGIVMGTYSPIKAAIEPLTGPLRYLPVSAVTGLFILVLGIEEEMKIAFLFLGIVVYLLPIVVESIENVDDVYLQTAYTLGASQWQSIRRVLLPAAWPSIWEACRVIYGIGWTYVILAELINARYGLGYLITLSYKRGHIDWAYALVIVVLLLGIATNYLFVLAARKMFVWRPAR